MIYYYAVHLLVCSQGLALARSRMNGREVEGTERSRAHGPASPSRPGYEVGCWAVIQQALAMRSRSRTQAWAAGQ